MKVKIFTQPSCPTCPPAKELGKKLQREGIKVDWQDTSTIDGLSDAQYYGIMSTPSIVIVDNENKEIKSWRGEVPSLQAVKNQISKVKK